MENKLICKALVGSRAYGTHTKTSDYDYKGIYLQNNEEILLGNWRPQYEIGKDQTYYEIAKFLQLAKTANPTMLELLYVDTYDHITPQFEYLRKMRHVFLTKLCAQSFGGYAVQQIKKARGLDKKMNWENSRMERKEPIDFIFYLGNGRAIPIKEWLSEFNYKQELCGLIKISHTRDTFGLYYDTTAELKYRGLQIEEGNDLRLSSIPKGQIACGTVYYNKDNYSNHCRDYNEYQTWLKNRNTDRYVDTKTHGQKIDGKNIMHCVRLLDMAEEIATTGRLTVHRENYKELLEIRKGNVDLEELLKKSEERIKKLDVLYKESTLLQERVPEAITENILRIFRNV